MAAMLEFRTRGFNPYAVKYSPYFDSRIAVAAAANYGIVGNGKLFVLGLTAQGIRAEKTFDTNDALYDLAWSEINERQLVVATGDGSIKLFDMGAGTPGAPAAPPQPTGAPPPPESSFPVMSFHEHKREVLSVVWSPTSKDVFASSSWDGTVKLWSPTRTSSLVTLPIGSCAYSVAFSPLSPQVLSAVSTDSHLRIFDLRVPASARYHLVGSIATHAQRFSLYTGALAAGGPGRHSGSLPGAHAASAGWPSDPAELLTHDWNKYRPSVVATGGVDTMLRIFDVRFASPATLDYPNPPAPGASTMPIPSRPRSSSDGPPEPGLSVLKGHGYAVRRLAWSPHHADILLSAGYDMTARVWQDEMVDVQRERAASGGGAGPGPDGGIPDPQLGIMNRHTEFVTGVDWCLFGMPGWVATVGWDERLLLWDANTFIRR